MRRLEQLNQLVPEFVVRGSTAYSLGAWEGQWEVGLNGDVQAHKLNSRAAVGRSPGPRPNATSSRHQQALCPGDAQYPRPNTSGAFVDAELRNRHPRRTE